MASIDGQKRGSHPAKGIQAIEYDYIIVGAGSAGSVIAHRLTQDSNLSVLLVEAGGSDRSVFIRMPAAFSIPMNTRRFAWQFHTEPEPAMDNRRLHCPRGKVIGGSSSINGMVHVRGHRADFDEWQALGAEGWGYEDCLPWFRRSENWTGGGNEYRGNGGPLTVSVGESDNPLYQAFIDAGVEAGYPYTPDYNGEHQEGFSTMQMTVRDGIRCSTAVAYLRPALKRPNLTLETGAVAHRILLEGDRAVGLEYSRGRSLQRARASREVIVCAGAIGSPHLLQLSGIGEPAELERADIPVHHALPAVGKHLTDHLEFYFQFECRQPITLNSRLGLLGKAAIGLEWLATRKGAGATNHFESCGFIRSSDEVAWPDIQYHFLPAAMRYDGRTAFAGHGFQLHVGHNKPKSTGSVEAVAPDPLVAPRIRFNYLKHPDDVAGFRRALRLSREIVNQPALEVFRGREITPGESVQSDEDIDAFIRANAESAYHPCGSCRMGDVDDDDAVVDPRARVRGISGLRVADASIFPSIPNGNLNAPTVMAGEKISDLILQG